MHFRALAAAVLASTPLAVSAAGQLGFSVGNVNPDNTCKTKADFEADLKAIAANSQSKLVRTYSSSDSFGNPCGTPGSILAAAKAQGFKVLLGMWPDGGAYTKEKAAITSANVGQYGDTLYGITVGSEGMYRGTYHANDLTGWLDDMEKSFPGVLIGTADSWNCWANGTMDSIIKRPTKLILANGFAYWQYQALNNATHTYFDDMAQALAHVQSVSGSLDQIHFMNGETGWPGDGGSDAGAAKAGTQNAAAYWKSAVCGMLNWGIDLFWFEAFDEPGKADAIGDNGQKASEKYWGSFDSQRKPKFNMAC